MEPTGKKLEDRLKDVGIRLASPPSAVDELLRLLDQTEIYLSRVDQSPSPSMFDALRPAMNSLISNELLNHPEINVKVFVAACINEITRITAPDAPYSDSLMKDIFAVIVDAFGKLDDISSSSYSKKVSILETMAKVRSCVVMLDLECDDLILQMFKHFLKSIRPDHSINVFSSMETIMTLVLEDSEYISEELVHCLLSNVHKSKKDVLPVACRLAETVISNCAMKLKPNLLAAVKLTGICLSDYTDKVASICQECFVSPEQNEVEESKLPERTVHNELPQESKKSEKSESCFEEIGAFADKARKVLSNGRVPLGNVNPIVEPVSSEFKHENEQCKNNIAPMTEDINLGSINEKPGNELDLKHVDVKSSSVQLPDASDSSRVEDDKEASSPTIRRVGRKRKGKSLKSDDMAPKTEVLLEPQREFELLPFERLVGDDKCVISATASDNLLGRGQKRKTKSLKSDGASDIAPKRTGLLEPEKEVEFRPLEVQVSAKKSTPHKTAVPSGKKRMSENTPMGKECSLAIVSEHKEDHCAVSNFNKKPSLDSAKKSLEDNATVDVSTTLVTDGMPCKEQKEPAKNVTEGIGFRKQWKSSIKQPKFKDSAEGDISAEPCLKEMLVSSKALREADNDEINVGKSVETHSTKKSRRKTSGMRVHIGRKIEVWWSDDQVFYKGVIELFDPVTEKHKVVYEDGDIEFLCLRNERWHYIDSENLEKGHEDDNVSLQTSMQVLDKPQGDDDSSGKFIETPERGRSGKKSKATPIQQAEDPKPAIKSGVGFKRETSKVAASSNEKTKGTSGSDGTKVDVSSLQANNSKEPIEDNTSSKVKSDGGRSVKRSRRKGENNQQTATEPSEMKNDTSRDAGEVKDDILTPTKLEGRSEGEPEARFGGRSRKKSALKSTRKPIGGTSSVGTQTDAIMFEEYITHKILERKKETAAATLIDVKNFVSGGTKVDDSGASGSQGSASKRRRK